VPRPRRFRSSRKAKKLEAQQVDTLPEIYGDFGEFNSPATNSPNFAVSLFAGGSAACVGVRSVGGELNGAA